MKTQTGLTTISMISVVALLLLNVGVLTTMILCLIFALALVAYDVWVEAY